MSGTDWGSMAEATALAKNPAARAIVERLELIATALEALVAAKTLRP